MSEYKLPPRGKDEGRNAWVYRMCEYLEAPMQEMMKKYPDLPKDHTQWYLGIKTKEVDDVILANNVLYHEFLFMLAANGQKVRERLQRLKDYKARKETKNGKE